MNLDICYFYVQDAPSCMALACLDLPTWPAARYPDLASGRLKPAVYINSGRTSSGKTWKADAPILVPKSVWQSSDLYGAMTDPFGFVMHSSTSSIPSATESPSASSPLSSSAAISTAVSASLGLSLNPSSGAASACPSTSHSSNRITGSGSASGIDESDEANQMMSFATRDLLLVGDTRGQTSVYDLLTQRLLAKREMHGGHSVRCVPIVCLKQLFIVYIISQSIILMITRNFWFTVECCMAWAWACSAPAWTASW